MLKGQFSIWKYNSIIEESYFIFKYRRKITISNLREKIEVD